MRHTLIIALNCLYFAIMLQAEATSQSSRLSDFPDKTTVKLPEALQSAELGGTVWKGEGDLCAEKADAQIRFLWKGGNALHFIWSEEKISWQNKYMEFILEWHKDDWSFDTVMMPVLRCFDKEGKIIIPEKFKYPEETALEPEPDYIRLHARWRAPEFGSPYPGKKSIGYLNTVELPADTAFISFGFSFEGGPASCKIEKIAFAPAKEHDYHYLSGQDTLKVKFENPKPLNRNEVTALLEKREKPNVKLQRKGDRVIMTVNGEEVMPIVFKNGPVHGSMKKELVRDKTFRQTGFKIFTVNIPLGQSRTRFRGPIWKDEDLYDIKQMEDAVYDLLSQVPDAFIVFEILVNNYYEWGLAHPEDVFTYSDGTRSLWASSIRGKTKQDELPVKDDYLIWMGSLQSDRFRHDVPHALNEVFRRFEKTLASNAVIGTYLNGTGDNQWFSTDEKTGMDHSPASICAWRQFLRQRYGNSLEKLCSAWKRPDASFDNAMPPKFTDFWTEQTLYPDDFVPDYNRFLAEYNFRLMDAFSYAVKMATDGRFLVGAYWPNGGMDGFPFPTHRNVDRLCNSPYFDFFAVVPQYYEYRECGHPLFAAAYNGSLRLHNKLLLVELDIRNPEIDNWGIWGSRTYAYTHTPHTFHEFAMRTACWSMALGGTFHAYDLSCGFWDTQNAIRSWKDAMDVCRQFRPSAEERMADRIAMLTDEQAPNYTTLHRQFRLYAYNQNLLPHIALSMSGLGFDFYLTADALNSEWEPPKLVILAETGTMPPEDGALLRQKLCRNGRVIVWMGTPGYLNRRCLADAEAISGFKLGERRLDEPLTADANCQDALMKGVTGTLFPRPNWGHAIGPVCTINDPDSTVLARFQPSGLPGMAVKRHPDCTEVFIGQSGALTPQLLRNLALLAGITPIQETNDICYQSGGIATVCASTGGVKRYAFPNGVKGYNILSGHKTITQNDKFIEILSEPGDTIVLQEVSK